MIEKILDRLSAESKKWLDIWNDASKMGGYDKYADGMNDAFDEAISIVQEVAKDGGWIPCSERLPEKYRICWITWKVDGYSEEVYRATCYKWGWFCIDTQEEFEPHEVVAWKYYEKPAPYQKGE